MSGKRRKKESAVPEVTPAQLAYQKWVTRVYALAGVCLAGLALAVATKTATPLLKAVFMIGIGLAGTVAWVMQAKRRCPQCGELYGYHIRIVNANTCRHCGAEFPRWRPGVTEPDEKSG